MGKYILENELSRAARYGINSDVSQSYYSTQFKDKWYEAYSYMLETKPIALSFEDYNNSVNIFEQCYDPNDDSDMQLLHQRTAYKCAYLTMLIGICRYG